MMGYENKKGILFLSEIEISPVQHKKIYLFSENMESACKILKTMLPDVRIKNIEEIQENLLFELNLGEVI